jgi:hypothetical protein
MNSKNTKTTYKTFMFLFLIGSVNSQCFTMPPKVMPVSTWSISIPNVNSPSFIHQSHPCPNSYELHSQYSHLESFVINTILNVKVSTLNIYGYSVCCVDEWENSHEDMEEYRNST